jgi:predicted ATP-dependent protease
MRPLYYIFILLMALNLAQVILNYSLLDNLAFKEEAVMGLAEELQKTSAGYSSLLEEVGRKDEALMEQQKKLQEAERKIVSLGTEKKWIYALGVTEGRGMALKLYVEKRPGEGRILVDIKNTLLETDLQGAALNSLSAAQNLTGAEIRDDIVFTMRSPLKGELILTGESAGAAMAIAIVALLEDREIRKDVVITGAVTRTGKIRKVSQIESKAQAAREAGAKVLLVPKGQGRDVNIPGLRLVEVGTLEEALGYMLT